MVPSQRRAMVAITKASRRTLRDFIYCEMARGFDHWPRRCDCWEMIMAWTTPVVVELCLGMEVTSYESASL
jgi:coenzyme PQQ precursor peptide PqqA